MTASFVSSVYTFTDPIRFFKENDPYYYKVDNIPHKQTHENVLWLKDQLTGFQNQGNVDRRQLSELKPYFEGGDRVVKVRPGRFSARINDAYNLTQLQQIELITGTDPKQYVTASGYDYSGVLDLLKSNVAASATYMNGLAERMLNWPTLGPDKPGTTSLTAELSPFVELNSQFDGYWPLKTTNSIYKKLELTVSYRELPRIANEFIKKWRGVGRIAIVDVPEELTVNISKFLPERFFYRDESGEKVEIANASTRIDLLFLYSKPVDASAVHIQSWAAGSPEKITAPVLGVLEGAGLGLNAKQGLDGTANSGFKTFGDNNKKQGVTAGSAKGYHSTIDGLKMLPNVADQLNTDAGFQGLNVHGSFPAPDDLLNLSPNLMENLTNQDAQLIGQTILPLAYIVVNDDETTLTDANLIDIRPFLRTTEFSYNERAGVMAANPSLSFANPAVGEFQLSQKVADVESSIKSSFGTETIAPRVVAGGTLWGGKKFGPEGALENVKGIGFGLDETQTLFPNVPDLPDWDLAEWWDIHPNLITGNQGDRRNDRVNMYTYNPAQGKLFDGGSNTNKSLGTGNHNGVKLPLTFLWCKKEILIDKDSVPWMDSYTVDCTLKNCVTATMRGVPHENSEHSGGAAGVFVETKDDRFIIYVAWVADDAIHLGHETKLFDNEPHSQRSGAWFSGFIARFEEMGNGKNNAALGDGTIVSNPKLGACTYPTVEFKVTGYPASHYWANLNAQTPTIELK